MMKNTKLTTILNTGATLTNLPTPTNLSFMWNFGSLLSMSLVIQIITGLLLSMHYTPDVNMAFNSLSHITHEVNMGWLMRNMHANGASLFFLCMYLHMARGFIYSSYFKTHVWMVGVTIYILTMATAFMGYLLPWGQMSFWGATVITNLFSAIPYIGDSLVQWLWGGFGVAGPTLKRFYSLHFLLPFMIAAMSLIHLLLLHSKGSSNPTSTQSNHTKIPFHILFTIKDILGILMAMILLMMVSLFSPNYLTDPENFIAANSLVTPTHIKPEWYFLWAYAILRSIPNKLGGVIMMFMAIIILYLCPISNPLHLSAKSSLNYVVIMTLFASWMILTFEGGQPVEEPYVTQGKAATYLYFISMSLVLIKIPMLPNEIFEEPEINNNQTWLQEIC